MSTDDDQEERIAAIVGDDEELAFEDGVKRFYDHLKKSLQLPCEVTGIEDFEWEEYYVTGPGDEVEYGALKRTQPCSEDRYDLVDIQLGANSAWMLYLDEDIGAICRRRSDGREFCLGLAELGATDRRSKNRQLLDDYSVWFVNSR